MAKIDLIDNGWVDLVLRAKTRLMELINYARTPVYET